MGLKSFSLLFKMAATINVPPRFRYKTPALQAKQYSDCQTCTLSSASARKNNLRQTRHRLVWKVFAPIFYLFLKFKILTYYTTT